MTPNEFKAWFDGFTEAFTGCPTKAQWTRIKARVAEIDGKPVTHTVYLDRYIPSVPPNYWYWSNRYGLSGSATTCIPTANIGAASGNACGAIGSGGMAFNSLQAMSALGRAEAAEMA